jgi:hypothetical protein
MNNNNFHNIITIWTQNKGHHRIWQICFISLIYLLLPPQYEKCDDFNFAIVDFPFLCRNIPLPSAYVVYISQLILLSWACFAYEDFTKRGILLTNKLMLQVYNESCSKSSFRNSMVAIMTLFAITNYHWPIYLLICFILFARLPFPYWLIPYIYK